MPEKFSVTPWEVTGEADYGRLVEQFGLSLIDQSIIDRFERHRNEVHYMLSRQIFFAHRDLPWLFDQYEKGNKFYLYTGRGPSGETHLGHIISWIFTKYLQDKFDAKVYFQLTDDEKFLFKPELSLDDVRNFSYENALDFIALGFDPKKTFLFLNTEYAKTLYREALKVAKHITFSMAKSSFGFNNETNVGEIFYTSMQAVPAFIESVKQGYNVPCLIPHGVDQDPHFRLTRDTLPKLGYYKPAQIECNMMPGLLKGGKMSASEPKSAVYTTDTPEDVRRKILGAFTGGRDTAEEQRKYGANPDVCTVCQNFLFLFEQDDDRLKHEIYDPQRTGRELCGENKERLIARVQKFLSEHQKNREKARKIIDKFILKD
jgi:tryptophanyl-tRNA synthetase